MRTRKGRRMTIVDSRTNMLLIAGVLIVGIVGTCAQNRDGVIREEIPVPYDPPQKVVPEFTPLPPSTPRNWWGTRDKPVVWPE